jgi:hypothetical protein
MVSGRGTRAQACAGKQAHARRAEATAHLWRLVAAGEYAGRLRVYRCRHCNGWHVGHWNRRGWNR